MARRKTGRLCHSLIYTIMACMIAAGVSGCSRAEALGRENLPNKGDSGALFLVQEKDSQAAESAEAMPGSTAGDTAAGSTAAAVGSAAAAGSMADTAAGSTAAAAVEESNEAQSFVHNDGGDINYLSGKECKAMEAFLNEEGSYGFLVTTYEVPEQLDASQIFYIGGGLDVEVPEGDEREAYLEAAGLTEDPDVIRLTAAQINDYLQYRAGVSLGDLYEQPDWVFLPEYRSYYITHGDEDTNIRRIEVLDAFEQKGVYTVHYREVIPEKVSQGWHVPVYEVTLRRNGDGYRFCANRLWSQKDMLLDGTRAAMITPGGFVTLYTYEPVSKEADATFVIERDKHILWTLPGWTPGNMREAGVFEGVEGISFGDYDEDGSTDILILCRYSSLGEGGRPDGLEARLYHCRKDEEPELDIGMSRQLNEKLPMLTLSGAAQYLRTGRIWEKFSSYQEAYRTVLDEAANGNYKGFALLKIEEGRTPELLMMGADEQTGARIVSYHDGVVEEKQISRSFSYLTRLNLVCAKRGKGGVYEENIYMFSGGKLGLAQHGIYGSLDSAVTIIGSDGKPVYSYFWDDAPVNEKGYADAKAFIYDTPRAEQASDIKLKSREKILRGLK